MDRKDARFFIEVTSHCRDGKFPRWSFWVQCFGSNTQQAMLGTDKHGCGLYQYARQLDQLSANRELIAADAFSMPDTLSRQQANAQLSAALEQLGWGKPAVQRAMPNLAEPTLRMRANAR